MVLVVSRHMTNGNETRRSRYDMTTSLWMGLNYEMPVAPHREMPVFGTKDDMRESKPGMGLSF